MSSPANDNASHEVQGENGDAQEHESDPYPEPHEPATSHDATSAPTRDGGASATSPASNVPNGTRANDNHTPSNLPATGTEGGQPRSRKANLPRSSSLQKLCGRSCAGMDASPATGHTYFANERGSVMHTTPYGYGAVYDPDALRTLGTVFENSWASIAANFDASSREPARLRLAEIILEFASEGATSPLELKCRAIGAMQYPARANATDPQVLQSDLNIAPR